MMRLLRKHRNWLMMVIAILAIPFVFYFNKTDFGAKGPGNIARVYGHDVSVLEAQRGARLANLARDLEMQDFLRSLAVGARSENDFYSQFTLNRLVLRHEA